MRAKNLARPRMHTAPSSGSNRTSCKSRAGTLALRALYSQAIARALDAKPRLGPAREANRARGRTMVVVVGVVSE
jgi:hypothetical protein